MEKKELVFVLELDGIKAIYLDIDGVCDSLKMEFENLTQEDALETEFKVSCKLLTESELDNLPEFDGF